jgi:hypothetical protein
MRDTYSDLEETLEPHTLAAPTLRRVADDEGTRLMTLKHGARSSTRSRVADRVVPSPFPTLSKPIRPVPLEAMRPQAPSEPTWLRPSQNIKLPETPKARVFQPFPDFDFSEFEDEEASDQMCVVHGYRTLEQRLANPMTQEDAELCWEHAHQRQMQMQRLQYAPTQLAEHGFPFPLESGVRPITVIPKAQATPRVSVARLAFGFLLAVAVGAAATASWRGDLNESELRYVGMEAQITAQNMLNHTSTTPSTHAQITRWK